MKHWIRFANGQLGGIYEGEEIKFGEYTINSKTPDSVLFEIGVLRLKIIGPEFPDIPHIITQGPIYEFATDGTPEVTQKYIYKYITLEDLRREKIQKWYFEKDRLLREGLTYNGRTYDMRFRNIAYLTLLATLINNNRYPIDFKWFDREGNTFVLEKEECLNLIEKAITLIINIEGKAQKILNKINSITDLHELSTLDIIIE